MYLSLIKVHYQPEANNICSFVMEFLITHINYAKENENKMIQATSSLSFEPCCSFGWTNCNAQSQLDFCALAQHISMTMISFLKIEGEVSRHKHTQPNTKCTLFQSRLTMMGFFISRPEGRIFPYSKQTGTEIACHYPQPPSISTLTPAYQPHLLTNHVL